MDDYMGYIDDHEATGAPHPDTFTPAVPKTPDFTEEAKIDPYKGLTKLEKKQLKLREEAAKVEKERVDRIEAVQGIYGGQQPKGRGTNIQTLADIKENKKLGQQDEELISVAEVDYSNRKTKARR